MKLGLSDAEWPKKPQDAGSGKARYDERELRGMLRGIIRADPGVAHEVLLRRLGDLGDGADAALSTLEAERMIRSLDEGDIRRYYPAGLPAAATGTLTGLQMLILRTVQCNEGQSTRKVAGLLEIPASAVERHARKMAEIHLLRLDRGILGSRCYLWDMALAASGDEGE